MTQPISSKLAIVAQCMNEFVRRENEAYTLALSISDATANFRQLQLQGARELIDRLQRRVRELEDDLTESEDRLTTAHEIINQLEISILECEQHDESTRVTRQQRARWHMAPMELIDLTTDEETELDV